MAEDQSSMILLVVVVLVAVLGLGLSLASFATNESMSRMMGGGGGGMMNPPTTTATSTPGGLEWGILILSAAFLAIALALLMRTRRDRIHAAAAGSTRPGGSPLVESVPSFVPHGNASVPVPPSIPAAVPEPTLVKLLDEDEKRMYLELRDHGGQMLQKDLVALGFFSKAKVTRVLDKLETKGIVVREAHGMTNRVRLVPQAGK